MEPDQALISEITQLRRDLHQHPELAYQEVRTSGIVRDILQSLGCEVTSGLAKTGLVGIMDFGPGPVLGLRADMDALPMHEATGRTYASRTPGIMHACGHDGHTAILIMAATLLAGSQGLSGKLVLVFQPAEENEGGAQAMVADGLFDRFPMDCIFGLHNMPGMSLGEVRAATGAVSAAFDTFDIVVHGQGGHGAMPHLGTDPIAAAAGLVSALNTIVSRNVDPQAAAVLSHGVIHCEGTYNVIPDRVQVSGSCRSFDARTRDLLEARVKAISRGLGMAYGTKNRCRYQRRYPPVINAPAPTRDVHLALNTASYPYRIHDSPAPVMGSEDFAFFSEQVPGCFLMLGAGDTGGGLHSVTYDFNDAALVPGAMIWVALAHHFLGPDRA